MTKKKNRSSKGRSDNRVTISRFTPSYDFLANHISGVPQTTRRTLGWTYYNTLAVAAGTYAEPGVILLNSPYDPDTAFGGVSATGFAKMMQFYSKCYCMAATIKWRVVSQNASYTDGAKAGLILGLTITTNSTSLANVDGAINSGLVKYAVLGGSPDRELFQQKIDIGRFLHKPNVLDDSQLFCTASANPSQLVVAHTWLFQNSPGTGTLILQVYEVEYECVFTDPIPFT